MPTPKSKATSMSAGSAVVWNRIGSKPGSSDGEPPRYVTPPSTTPVVCPATRRSRSGVTEIVVGRGVDAARRSVPEQAQRDGNGGRSRKTPGGDGRTAPHELSERRTPA